MVESNYDILGITENSTETEVRNAFRQLALRYHSDRGGENEQFIKIKQAYEDLKIGKKYPETDLEKIRNSRVYSGDSEEDIRRKNQILGQELSKEMKLAEEWAANLNRTNSTATRLFGSKTLGEIELERKANGTLSIKGNFMAGNLTYDGSIIMQGNITSPSWTEEFRTNIHLTKGDFKFINPLENKYKIENGSRIIVDNGDIIIGNVFGRKYKIQDAEGRVGIYETKEQRTYISAPKGKIIAENIVNTVSLNADSIVVLNLEDDVQINAREIFLYGNKITYNVIIKLKKHGIIRFFENFSIQSLSNDAIIKLENGKEIRLFEIKTKKIKDLADEFVPNKNKYDKNATMVGDGFTITYEMLDNLSKKPTPSQNSNRMSKFGFSRN
ncbi:MAG: DnaJ domain-containing protein [Nitrosarchaeum sp.]